MDDSGRIRLWYDDLGGRLCGRSMRVILRGVGFSVGEYATLTPEERKEANV